MIKNNMKMKMQQITDSTLNNHVARRKYIQDLYETSLQDKMTMPCISMGGKYAAGMGGSYRCGPYRFREMSAMLVEQNRI